MLKMSKITSKKSDVWSFLQCKVEYHLQEDDNAGSDATCTSSSMINSCSSPTPSTSSTKTFHRQSTIDDAFKVQRSYEFGGSKDAAISQALIFMQPTVASERLVSTLNNVCSDSRSRLTPTHANELTMSIGTCEHCEPI
ncbi:unnamed protein product [Callosobruchus maculatus]|uniref:Uncharacterized protein n=1 Tax=Callosobruchus maculatus TaxID=64391 RepID=A0A653D577_CALMS|nr:unnamed protein product [Callosobruchus maculatus]